MRRLRSIDFLASVSVWFPFCRVKYHRAAGNSVIRPLPLALDFNATLRCPMPKTRVPTGQWAVTIFAQDKQPDGCLLVRGCVGHFICEAAGETVHRALGRVHRHVEFFALHPVGYQRPDPDLAITRNKLNPGASLDPALRRER